MQIADFIFYFSPDQKLYEMHCIIKKSWCIKHRELINLLVLVYMVQMWGLCQKTTTLQ